MSEPSIGIEPDHIDSNRETFVRTVYLASFPIGLFRRVGGALDHEMGENGSVTPAEESKICPKAAEDRFVAGVIIMHRQERRLYDRSVGVILAMDRSNSKRVRWVALRTRTGTKKQGTVTGLLTFLFKKGVELNSAFEPEGTVERDFLVCPMSLSTFKCSETA